MFSWKKPRRDRDKWFLSFVILRKLGYENRLLFYYALDLRPSAHLKLLPVHPDCISSFIVWLAACFLRSSDLLKFLLNAIRSLVLVFRRAQQALITPRLALRGTLHGIIDGQSVVLYLKQRHLALSLLKTFQFDRWLLFAITHDPDGGRHSTSIVEHDLGRDLREVRYGLLLRVCSGPAASEFEWLPHYVQVLSAKHLLILLIWMQLVLIILNLHLSLLRLELIVVQMLVCLLRLSPRFLRFFWHASVEFGYKFIKFFGGRSIDMGWQVGNKLLSWKHSMIWEVLFEVGRNLLFAVFADFLLFYLVHKVCVRNVAEHGGNFVLSVLVLFPFRNNERFLRSSKTRWRLWEVKCSLFCLKISFHGLYLD